MPAIIVLLVCVGLFLPWLVAGKVLAPLDLVSGLFEPWRGEKAHPLVHNHFVTDAVSQYIPYRKLMHESIRQDGYVGWNPLIFGGTAQHANTMLINNEVTMLLHRVSNFWTAWNLGRLLQFLIAGLGMLVFLRSRGSPRGVATMGALAYMLNYQFVAWIYFNQAVATFCWIPLILWALHKTRDGTAGYAAMSSGFICLALLGATLQQAAFVVAVLLCLWLAWVFEGNPHKLKWVQDTWTIVFPSILGAGLAAFALEPSIAAYLENEGAAHGRGCFAYEEGWSQPLWHIVASPMTVYPFFLGSVQSLDLWKLFRFDVFNVGCFGTVPMLVAVIGMFSRRVPLAAKLMMLAGVIVPLTPLVGYVYHRFNIVWIFGGCWAGAAWLTQASDADIARLNKLLSWIVGLGIALWAVASMALLFINTAVESWLRAKVVSMASGSVYGLFTAWMQQRASDLVNYLYLWNPWQLLALGGLLLSLWGLPRIRSGKLSSYAPAIGVALQLSVFWWQWTTWTDPRMPYGTSALETILQEHMGTNGRLAMKPRPWSEYVAPPNTLMPAGVAITGGYDAMHPHGMSGSSRSEWDFPGTTHFLGRSDEDSPEGWSVIWSDGKWRVWENPHATVGVVFKSTGPDSLARAAVSRPTFNTMRVTVPRGARWLEIFSNWHRGWRWKEDRMSEWNKVALGENRTIRIDFDEYLSQERTVNLRYDPTPPAWVRLVSLVSFLGVLAIGATGLLGKTGLLRLPSRSAL